MDTPINKGISFPFRFDGTGKIAMSKLSNFDTTKIDDSIKLILLTAIRERRMEVNFGSRGIDIVFQENDPSVDAMVRRLAQQALKRWEPRVAVDEDTIEIVRENGKIKIGIEYVVIPTQETRQTLVDVGDLNE